MSSFVFLSPWLLAALAALPALWLLLRIMPPAPKRIMLPSARFLEDVLPKTKTPSQTPWWILMLRLVIAGLVIFALAQPVFNPSQNLDKNDTIRIVFNNDWSSSDDWDTKIRAARELLAQAERNNIQVYLHTTSNEPNDGKPISLGPLSANEALSRLNGLEPHAWPANLRDIDLKNDGEHLHIDSYYFSDGLRARGFNDLIDTLSQLGSVTLYQPKPENLPLALRHIDTQKGNPVLEIIAPETIARGLPITLQGIGKDGDVLGIENAIINSTKTEVAMRLGDGLRNDLSYIKITGRENAAGIYLFGDHFRQKRVGIVSPNNAEDTKPYVEADFYLTRALEPYADLKADTLDSLLNEQLSMIIMADIAALSPSQLERLEAWVREGGLLLRFAGSVMEQARQHFLVPTPLRSGARSLDGALRWETPPKLTAFAVNSPLSSINIGEEIIIKQQLLAEPVADLETKTWAMLDDGTPLITADTLDQGLIVMVHTAASPDWSNLPLSGAFVQLLSRLVTLAGSPPALMQASGGPLEPILVLDGNGRLIKPAPYVRNISADNLNDFETSYQNPPGIYGAGAISRPFNLGDEITSLTPIEGGLMQGVNLVSYDSDYEQNLMPVLLTAGLILLVIDWVIMLAISTNFSSRLLGRSAATILLVFIFNAPSYAQGSEQYKHADGLYIGFIRSANTAVNAQTRAGLEELQKSLTRRTSAEPDGVVALDPARDTLSFFPFIYWPVDAGDKTLSEEALRNIQDYLDQGGTILFDTRESGSLSDFSKGGPNAQALARVTQGLNIPALAPIAEDHVLGKSFYLLDSFPGRYSGGTIWIESASENGRDGVSSVIIGSHDWAGAWAENAGRNYRAGSTARQRELAVRFGVNMMMYALTGNYKADQVHVEHILERLGQ